MTNSMRDLANQYTAEAENLKRLITNSKLRRTLAMKRGNHREGKRLERLVELHEQQRADLLRIAARLRHYYPSD